MIQFKSTTNNVRFIQNTVAAASAAPKRRGKFFTVLGALIWLLVIWAML